MDQRRRELERRLRVEHLRSGQALVDLEVMLAMLGRRVMAAWARGQGTDGDDFPGRQGRWEGEAEALWRCWRCQWRLWLRLTGKREIWDRVLLDYLRWRQDRVPPRVLHGCLTPSRCPDEVVGETIKRHLATAVERRYCVSCRGWHGQRPCAVKGGRTRLSRTHDETDLAKGLSGSPAPVDPCAETLRAARRVHALDRQGSPGPVRALCGVDMAHVPDDEYWIRADGPRATRPVNCRGCRVALEARGEHQHLWTPQIPGPVGSNEAD